MIIQKRLLEKKELSLKKPYSLGSYNKFNSKEQWIRISEGCPHNCPYCYEPKEYKIFEIPKIVRNKVKIMDMNLLCKKEAFEIIKTLGSYKVEGKKVYYELICGIDYRFLDLKISKALKKNGFRKIRLAWDWFYKEQLKIKDSIGLLLKAGYKSEDIMIFMICNWKISLDENLKKMDLCKIWNVQIADCYFDGQVKKIDPIHWNKKEILEFRSKVRTHNRLVNFKIDPKILGK